MARGTLWMVSAGAVLAMAVSLPCWGAPEPVRMVTQEWAPFAGDRLPMQGAAVSVVRAVVRRMGTDVDLRFVPWSRAVLMARRDDAVVAYFPEYYDVANAQQFLYSEPIATSRLVLVQRKRAPVVWKHLDDLANKTIGVVRGFLSTEELDVRIADGRLFASEAPDDSKNLLKLAAGRLDVAVVDAAVFEYLLRNDPAVQVVSSELEVNAQVLEDKRLYVCFKKTPKGRALRDAFNQALKLVPVEAIWRQAMTRMP